LPLAQRFDLEIAARFGQESELRQAEMDSLRWLVDLAWRAGVQRIVANGSFVTEMMERNDVDCVLLIGADFPHDAEAEAELQAGLPFKDGIGGCGSVPTVHGADLCQRPQLGAKRHGGGCPMTIENRRQLENTRMKLQELEELYTRTQQAPAENEHVRELTLRSLKKRINQFKEEIVRFEAQVGLATRRERR
jgi:hypothetical protein